MLSEGTGAHYENEIAFPKHLVNLPVLHCQALLGQGLQTGDQAGQPVTLLKWIVLDIVISVKETPKFVFSAMKKVIQVCLHQRLVDLGLIEVGGNCRAIQHCVAAWTWLGGGFLQVVPMFDDLPTFKPEDIETDFRAEEIVISMSENEIAVFLKHPHRIRSVVDPFGSDWEKGHDASQAVAHGQVVLDILIGVDVGEGFAVTASRCS